MSKRANRIRDILNSIVPPELKAGWDRAHEYGEGYRPETEQFKTGPIGYSALQSTALKPNLTPAERENVLGYSGAFKPRQVLKDEQGNAMLDAMGNVMHTSANRVHDANGNFRGFEQVVDPLTKETTEAPPTGPMYGLGYTLGRAGIDWSSNASLGQYWTWNHPLGGASSMTRSILGNSEVAQGNRNTPWLSAMAPAVLMGAAAGNVALDNITSGEAGRAPGTQAVFKKRREDGTFDPDRQTETENAITEVALRYLGRSGYLIDNYADYADDMLEHGKLPVDRETYSNFKAQQFEKKELSNLFGLFKVTGTNPITGEASFQQMGYHVPVSAAASLGGALTAMGGMNHLMKNNPAILGSAGAPGTTARKRRGAALMGAAMGVGGLVGNAAGEGANDLIQRTINPRNHAFQEQLKEELKRRKGFIDDNAM